MMMVDEDGGGVDDKEQLRRRSSARKSRRSLSAKSAGRSSVKTGTQADEGDRVEEEMDAEVQPSSKRRSVSAAVGSAGRHLRSALAVLILAVLVSDVVVWGLRGTTSPFIDWWDLVGTVAYVRGRNARYSLRDKNNQKSAGWVLYVMLATYVLYDISGKACRTLLRRSPDLPGLVELTDFVVYGLLPVHFFPGDYLFNMVEFNREHGLIISLVWALTKTRSLNNLLFEAVNVNHLSPPQVFMLSMFSCEIASVLGRLDMSFTSYSYKECLRRFPKGLLSWLGSRTFMSSIVVSVFMVATTALAKIPVVWVIPNGMVFLACFYRYSNGTIEGFIADNMPVEMKAEGSVDAKLKSLVDKLDPTEVDLKTVPDKLVNESIKLAQSLIVSLDQLGTDSKVELSELIERLQEFSSQMEDPSSRKRKSA